MEAEATERVDNFKKDYQELVKKYDVDLVSFPTFVSTPNGLYAVQIQMQLIDKKNMPTPSPYQEPDEPIIK